MCQDSLKVCEFFVGFCWNRTWFEIFFMLSITNVNKDEKKKIVVFSGCCNLQV